MIEKVRINFLLNVTMGIINIIISIFVTAYIARVIGANNIGLYAYLVSIVSYFILFGAIGTHKYASREIAYCRDNKEEMSRVFFEVVILHTVMCSIALLVFLVSLSFSDFDYRLIIMISFFIVNEMLDITWFFQGNENFKILLKTTFAIRIVFVLALLIFVHSPDDFYAYVAIEVMYNILFNGSLWFHLHKYIKKVRNLHPLRHLKESLLLFLPSIAVHIYAYLDKTMLGYLAAGTYNELSYYSLAEGIVKSFLLLGGSLTSVTAPRVANLNANSEQEEITKTLYESYRICWFITLPITILIFISAKTIVPLYFGPGYDGVIAVMKLLSPIVIILTLNGITGEQFLIPCKYTNTQTAVLFGGLFINFTANALLIPRYHAIGACISTIAAEGFIAIVQLIVANRIGVIKIAKVLKEGRNYFLSSAFVIAFDVAAFHFLDTVSLYQLVLIIVAGLVIYFGLLILLRDVLVMSIIKRLKAKRMSV